MMEPKISIEENGPFVILSIHNPPANSLDRNILNELASYVGQLQEPSFPKAIILTGTPTLFSAGAELTELVEARTAKDAEKIVERAKSLMEKIETSKKPVIAAINGACLGGGLELALSCTIRIADETAKFGFPEINLGLMPGAGGTQRLTGLVGLAKTCEMILMGDLINAQEAYRIGLINRLATPGQSMSVAVEIAEKISKKSQRAVSSALTAIRASTVSRGPEGMKIETQLFGMLFGTEDAREGIKAFMEKREHAFKNT